MWEMGFEHVLRKNISYYKITNYTSKGCIRYIWVRCGLDVG